MRRSNLLILICMIVGLVVLCGLGTWQVKRLYWKEALISRVADRVARPTVALSEIEQSGFSREDHEYLPVSIIGKYDHDQEVYFFTTGKGGQPGWHVHTPLLLNDGRFLVVNRGFVPFELKEASRRAESIEPLAVEVSGLLRFPLSQKPFGSLPNSLEKREFYWRNVGEMSEAMGNPGEFLPVILDRTETTGVENALPVGGTTILRFSNNHLQYAVTWYGLALTLLAVGGYFLHSRRQEAND